MATVAYYPETRRFALEIDTRPAGTFVASTDLTRDQVKALRAACQEALNAETQARTLPTVQTTIDEADGSFEVKAVVSAPWRMAHPNLQIQTLRGELDEEIEDFISDDVHHTLLREWITHNSLTHLSLEVGHMEISNHGFSRTWAFVEPKGETAPA